MTNTSSNTFLILVIVFLKNITCSMFNSAVLYQWIFTLLLTARTLRVKRNVLTVSWRTWAMHEIVLTWWSQTILWWLIRARFNFYHIIWLLKMLSVIIVINWFCMLKNFRTLRTILMRFNSLWASWTGLNSRSISQYCQLSVIKYSVMIMKASQFELLQQLRVNDIFVLKLRFFRIWSLMTLNLFSIKILICVW